jgi:exopolysaccharide biosynthesis protein
MVELIKCAKERGYNVFGRELTPEPGVVYSPWVKMRFAVGNKTITVGNDSLYTIEREAGKDVFKKGDNTAPGNGYQRQLVKTERGDYMVDIIAADLNSTKVIVDTASDSDCADNCPVMSLGDFASRSGAFAAVNGQYFCPSTYPSCAGKANAFDTLLMNKNKVYFNSANNVYSTNPAAVFGSGYSRFMGRASDWGRDTGVDAVVSNYPLLVSGGNIAVSDSGDAKQSGKGSRAFIGGSGNIAYIGVIYNANVTDMGYVLKTMGVQNALNLDSGGSLALWSNGRYIAGPGRGLPFGILFVRR